MPIIDNNYVYEAVTETVTKPIVAVRGLLEFLNNCSMKCKGCFVDKKNGYTDQDLIILKDMIQQVNNTGMLFDEVVIGPVDFFGASNTKDLLLNPIFKSIFKEHKPIFAVPTTLTSDNYTINEIITIINENYPQNMEVEFLIVCDPKKLANRDQQYIEWMKNKIQLLDQLIQPTCYTFQLNVQNIDDINLAEISTLVKEEFNTIIDINPSFFRSNKYKTIKSALRRWNNIINDQVTPESKNDIQMVVADPSHAGENYVNFIFEGGYFYLAPFIHEIAAIKDDAFKLTRSGELYDVHEIFNTLTKTKIQQYNYASSTLECEYCPHLSSCVSRYVLKFMEENNINECILPKKALLLYSDKNLGDAALNVYNWETYSTEQEILVGTNYKAFEKYNKDT